MGDAEIWGHRVCSDMVRYLTSCPRAFFTAASAASPLRGVEAVAVDRAALGHAELGLGLPLHAWPHRPHLPFMHMVNFLPGLAPLVVIRSSGASRRAVNIVLLAHLAHNSWHALHTLRFGLPT